MSLDAKQLKDFLVQAGLEVYRTRPTEVHVAERVRSHIMDSGVKLLLGEEGTIEVRFVARTQRSDYPEIGDDALFARVRSSVGDGAVARGFGEVAAAVIDVKDPSTPERTLDVWQEITYAKRVREVGDAIDDVRWVLGVERYVMP